MDNTKKVLLINTHLTYPDWSEGSLNNAFIQIAKDFFNSKKYEVLETRIEDGYDPDEEVEKHLEADIIILQMPVNWFGAPWIYKKYVDEVFNKGLFSKKFLSDDGRTREDPSRQYGTGGHLQEKKFMICATWNAPAAAFNDPKQELLEGRATADLLLPISSNYRFCGVEIVEGYNCFDIFKDSQIEQDLENYPSHLEKVFNISI
ncbi:modulator of drug activity B [Flavobacterium sp. HSC-32F16]|uniref:NAD(P)H-dependent oxidoreductase n=1 Tax=Flavobacterium sp. HSC-32F16 TaxID=2910964 RepID=UPI0020A281BA|nr:NAD(P)H-dependent oxidoreductase [Flavobacterium sp. HSC-32F16]MCP2025814.1 modulator of drug activity B [Flavobacterium sp. HSC-32F16]